jgi:hypothetical protein
MFGSFLFADEKFTHEFAWGSLLLDGLSIKFGSFLNNVNHLSWKYEPKTTKFSAEFHEVSHGLIFWFAMFKGSLAVLVQFKESKVKRQPSGKFQFSNRYGRNFWCSEFGNILCTMGQNQKFMKKLKIDFLRMSKILYLVSIQLYYVWVLDFRE